MVGSWAVVVSCGILLSVAVGKTTSVYPSDFVWGTATASYQIEGAVSQDGRGASIWDTFSHTPGKTANGDTGDVADDSYNLYPEDISLMKELGVKAYRFSIAWSRIMPTGEMPISQAGIEHYSVLIDTLLDAGIDPYITLYHWDLPQDLHDKYGGWLNDTIIDLFTSYADVCFSSFGDRVQHWITFNEPHEVSWQGYGIGTMAPGRCSDRSKCPEGDGETEPYIVSHNILLSHAQTVDLYRKKYQIQQGGIIGMTLNSDYYIPWTNSSADVEAAARQFDFQLGWYASPLFYGDYPESMRYYVGDRLPTFTADQAALLINSHDFFGLNHYTSLWVADNQSPSGTPGWDMDRHVSTTQVKDGVPIGPQADSSWLYVYPPGIQGVLRYVWQNYPSPIYITENGVDVPNESSLPLDEALADQFRIDYLSGYLDYVGRAITEDNVNLKGYFVWSLLDNFEWADGYTKRFGIHYVDYSNGLVRYAKQSSSCAFPRLRCKKKVTSNENQNKSTKAEEISTEKPKEAPSKKYQPFFFLKPQTKKKKPRGKQERHRRMKVAAVIVLIASLWCAAECAQGVDVSQLYATSSWSCLVTNGYSFAIPRGYRSSGSVDPNAVSNVNNARAGGIKYVDVYFFPCPTCSKSAATQVDELYNATKGVNIGMWWLDVEGGTSYWSSTYSTNQNWFTSWVSEVKAKGISFGVYTNKNEWTAIMGSSYTGGSAYQLWWASWTGSCSIGSFTSFAGWTKANIQQYAGDVSTCSMSVDKNCY
ncbi:glycosyl hydrolase family 1 [Pelomyxa schiedti]|nr:glycosyl hydrolase family 1 [Pelomyxa schiedti]